MEIISQTELRAVGHDCLSAILYERQAGILQLTPEYAIPGEQAIKTGILATLLRIEQDQSEIASALQAIAKDLSRLVAIQNMGRLIEER